MSIPRLFQNRISQFRKKPRPGAIEQCRSTASTSSPPAPPSTSIDDITQSFKEMTTSDELIKIYRPGGFHPVNLGDIFNLQYKVMRKLGEGCCSTVWLARDLKNGWGYVALKLFVSDTATDEVKILRHLDNLPQDGTKYITQLLDAFEHRGPKGKHVCLVFEPMGPNLNMMVEELPQFIPHMQGKEYRFPLRIAKTILKQALQALEFLHKNEIAHGNFQPSNILLVLRDDIGSIPASKLLQREDEGSASISSPVKKLDGKPDKQDPGFLGPAQSLVRFITWREGGLKVKLSDMRSAYFFDKRPSELIIPSRLRAPETILTGFFDHTTDIWCFGCLIFEIITGHQLFSMPYHEPDPSKEDDQHLLSLSSLLGPLPIGLYANWSNSWRYFTRERWLYNCRLGGVRKGEEPLMFEQLSLEQTFAQTGVKMDLEEAKQITALIRWILQYDSAERPSATDILDHPWFLEIDVDAM